MNEEAIILGSGTRIRKSDPKKYKRVAWHVHSLVMDGDLKPDNPVPSIANLCRKFDCTRQTVSKGLRLLVDEGLLTREQGLGYYVSENVEP